MSTVQPHITLAADLATIPTPRVVVERTRLDANIAAMQARANAAGVRLRPHTKTHKSPAIARQQLDAGAVGICCAKLGEAEVMAAAGIRDIRLPYPVQPSNAGRVIALLDAGTRVSIIVDDLAVARGWSTAMTAAGRVLDVLVKVDVGTHRCGVDPASPGTLDAIATIAALPGLRFRGLLSHAGHAYGAASEAEIGDVAEAEIRIHRTLRDTLAARGVAVDEISVGSTPSARCIGDQPGVTEMRPGNYVFFDRTQVGLGSTPLDGCALTILSTVVSRPAPDRVVFDAGSKALTSDGVRGFDRPVGHGLVFPGLDMTRPDDEIVIERLSEEHGVARLPPDRTLRPGDRVRIIPNHACVVVNLTDELIVADGREIAARLPVAARGRTW
ncbi:MAG: alanine racemase [Vicinamibacterales bacterium]